MTWKQQIDKVEKRAKTRLTLMRKLSGACWGADYNTQKKVYTGYLMPVLEYGIATWGTAAKSHFDRVKRIQNQVSRITTGGIKSIPIIAFETST